jgi:hypothetical protein
MCHISYQTVCTTDILFTSLQEHQYENQAQTAAPNEVELRKIMKINLHITWI